MGDFNNDGNVDVAMVEQIEQGGQIAVALGDGAGALGPATHYAVGNGPRGIVTGDFNQDGNLDLAVTNQNSGTVSVLMGDGFGGFVLSQTVDIPTPGFGIEAVDLNHDSYPDLVVGGAPNTTTVEVLLWNAATTSFDAPTTYPAGGVTSSIVVADFDGDGNPDVVASNRGTSNVSILYGDGAGGFGPPTQIPVGATVVAVRPLGDVNGDGLPDLGVTSTADGSAINLLLLLNDGAGGFGPPVEILPGSLQVGFATTGDVNLDGIADLVAVGFSSPSVVIRLGDGAGGFGDVTRFPLGSSPNDLVITDLNGDGRPDLVVNTTDSGDLFVLLNTCGAS